MLEAARYFKTRSATFKARNLSRQLHDYDPKNDIAAGVFWDGTTSTVGSGNVDYAAFLEKGLARIMSEVQEKLAALPVTTENSSRINFYRAVLISLSAIVHLANRYADLAEEMAAKEADPSRKAELLDMAAVCRHVPENPPRTFREAVQAWWFLHLGVQIEQAGCGSSPGRLGQYLDPYYQKDKRENGLTSEDAVGWLKCLFVKILEFGYYQGVSYSQLVSGHTGHTISLGRARPPGLGRHLRAGLPAARHADRHAQHPAHPDCALSRQPARGLPAQGRGPRAHGPGPASMAQQPHHHGAPAHPPRRLRHHPGGRPQLRQPELRGHRRGRRHGLPARGGHLQPGQDGGAGVYPRLQCRHQETGRPGHRRPRVLCGLRGLLRGLHDPRPSTCSGRPGATVPCPTSPWATRCPAPCVRPCTRAAWRAASTSTRADPGSTCTTPSAPPGWTRATPCWP